MSPFSCTDLDLSLLGGSQLVHFFPALLEDDVFLSDLGLRFLHPAFGLCRLYFEFLLSLSEFLVAHLSRVVTDDESSIRADDAPASLLRLQFDLSRLPNAI